MLYYIIHTEEVIEMNRTISENIMNLRKERGLTQIDLAKEINYSDKVISKWERGESLPNIEALETLAKYFDVTTDYFLGREDNNNAVFVSRQLEVKNEETPSLFFKFSLLIPLILWIALSFYGLQWFIASGSIFVLYWIIYCATMLNGTFIATYDGYEIKVIVRVKSIKMYIDDQLVDSYGVPIISTYKLSGLAGKRQIKARVSIFLFSKCEIFVE